MSGQIWLKVMLISVCPLVSKTLIYTIYLFSSVSVCSVFFFSFNDKLAYRGTHL